MSPARAARIAARGILARRRVVIPGVLNHLLAFTAWLVPRRVMGAVTRWLFGPVRPSLPGGSA
jgi:short-subunit dehydrogenase